MPIAQFWRAILLTTTADLVIAGAVMPLYLESMTNVAQIFINYINFGMSKMFESFATTLALGAGTSAALVLMSSI